MIRLLSESVILGLSFLARLARVTGGEGDGLDVLLPLVGNLDAAELEVEEDGDGLVLGVITARGGRAF